MVHALHRVLEAGSWIAWATLLLWAMDLVPGWVPQIIGFAGLIGCAARGAWKTRPR